MANNYNNCTKSFRSSTAKSDRIIRPTILNRRVSTVSCSEMLVKSNSWFNDHDDEESKYEKFSEKYNDRVDISDNNFNYTAEKLHDLKNSDLIFAMKSILISLKILGLWPKEHKKFFRRFGLQSYILFGYLHGYAIQNLINWFYSFHQSSGFYIFLENFSMVIRTFATAITFDLFFIHFFSTIDSLSMINNFPPLTKSTSLRSLRSSVLLLVIGSWGYLLIQLGFSLWSTATMPIQKFMNIYFYGITSSHVNETLMRFLMAAVWIAHIFITLSAEIFLKTLYVSSCLLLSRCARAYNIMVTEIEAQDVIGGDDLNNINRLHTQLTDLVRGVDKNFTKEAFIWIATIFLNICTKIGAIVISTNASDISASGMDIINYLVLFIFISLTAADVSHQCEILLPMAHRLASKADMEDLTVLYQAKLMVAKMSHPVARLWGWKCFVIDRPFILTLISAILTYSVVLMQMSRSVSARKKGFLNNTTSTFASSMKL